VYDDPDFAALALDRDRPFHESDRFLTYDPRRTGPVFTILKDYYLPAMLTDSRVELQTARQAILAGDAGRRSSALVEEFGRPLLGRAELEAIARELRATPRFAEAAFARREAWTRAFREKYADLSRRARDSGR
jgi:hypothetical protein